MPSGRTHDSITLWSLPLIAGATFSQTHSTSLTLLLSGGYLFSGLMFGPDLDIYSRQYQRWGILRWIWLPYRRSMRHRAFLSHGPLVGTVVRVVYLLSWMALLIGGMGAISAIAYSLTGERDRWLQVALQLWQLGSDLISRSWQQSFPEWIALGIGLELGALSHSLSDWLGSSYKRHLRRSPKPAVPNRPKPRPTIKPSLPTTVELPNLPRDSQLPPFR
jgi:uncharacterized metal-binding protein